MSDRRVVEPPEERAARQQKNKANDNEQMAAEAELATERGAKIVPDEGH